MKLVKTGLLLVALILVVSCGGDKGGNGEPTNPPPTEPQATETKAILVLFAGYNCASCNQELPELQQKLSSDFSDKAGAVEVRTYVVAGPQGKKVTQEVADQYGKDLGVSFKMFPDQSCRGEYKKYYPGSTSCLVPAAVLMKKDGTIVETFAPGKLNMDEFLPKLKGVVNG